MEGTDPQGLAGFSALDTLRPGLGPEAGWITGQNVGVDRGHALRRGPDPSSLLTDVFGAAGLRGVVPEG